jgi:hypothetical protein
MKRDYSWFEGTWETYIKPKYQKVVYAFEHRTGNGSGTKYDVHQYCTGKSLLESWIYLLDDDNNGLLRSFTSGTVPEQLRNEPGFDTEVSTSEDD